jgi:hypothetical protein
MAQSEALAGHVLRRQRCQLASDPKHLAAFEAVTTAVYTHRVNSAQMAAQAKFLDAIKVTAAAV